MPGDLSKVSEAQQESFDPESSLVARQSVSAKPLKQPSVASKAKGDDLSGPLSGLNFEPPRAVEAEEHKSGRGTPQINTGDQPCLPRSSFKREREAKMQASNQPQFENRHSIVSFNDECSEKFVPQHSLKKAANQTINNISVIQDDEKSEQAPEHFRSAAKMLHHRPLEKLGGEASSENKENAPESSNKAVQPIQFKPQAK